MSKQAPPKYEDADGYEPTAGEQGMARSMGYLVDRMLSGELTGIGVCAINEDGEHSCIYLNKADEDVLRAPMEQLRVMYETNRSFMRRDTTPQNNRSYRSH